MLFEWPDAGSEFLRNRVYPDLTLLLLEIWSKLTVDLLECVEFVQDVDENENVVRGMFYIMREVNSLNVFTDEWGLRIHGLLVDCELQLALVVVYLCGLGLEVWFHPQLKSYNQWMWSSS